MDTVTDKQTLTKKDYRGSFIKPFIRWAWGNQNLVQHLCLYEDITDLTNEDDFAYLDPPLSNTASIQHYTIDKFPSTEQEKVAEFAETLSNKGVKVLISNADLPSIRNLFKD